MMKSLLGIIVEWFSNKTFELSAWIDKIPDFMIGNLIEILGVLIASILVAVFSTLYVDKKREVQKVKARVLDMRLEQYDVIRSFVEQQIKTTAFPENADDVRRNFEISGLTLEGNEDCYSSQEIASEQKVRQVIDKLENLVMNGLYILDDDVLGMLLQIKIYIVNLNMFSIILRGYYDNKENESNKTIYINRQEEIEKNEKKVQVITPEDIHQICDFYYHHLSIFLNNEYQKMIEKLRKMVIEKASKPKFERKEKNYKKIRTRQRLQEKALGKTILMNKFPQLILALASLSSAHFREAAKQRDNTIKEFFEYAIEIIKWQDKDKAYKN